MARKPLPSNTHTHPGALTRVGCASFFRHFFSTRHKCTSKSDPDQILNPQETDSFNPNENSFLNIARNFFQSFSNRLAGLVHQAPAITVMRTRKEDAGNWLQSVGGIANDTYPSTVPRSKAPSSPSSALSSVTQAYIISVLLIWTPAAGKEVHDLRWVS